MFPLETLPTGDRRIVYMNGKWLLFSSTQLVHWDMCYIYISGHSVSTQRDRQVKAVWHQPCMYYASSINTILLRWQQGTQCMHNVTVWRLKRSDISSPSRTYQSSHFAGTSFGAKQETNIKFVDTATQQWVPFVIFSYKMSPCKQYIKFVAIETQQWVPFVLFSYKMSPCKQYIKSVAIETQQWVPSLLLTSYIRCCQQYKTYLGLHVRYFCPILTKLEF